MIKTVT